MGKRVTWAIKAIRAESREWHKRSDRMAPIKAGVAELQLSRSSFVAIGPTATLIGEAVFIPEAESAAYDKFHEFMLEVIDQGVTEFDQLGGALSRIAHRYDECDRFSALNLEKIYSVM